MKYNKIIDHTLLKADANKDAIVVLCQEALKYDFASVCINPAYVKLAHDELKSSDVKVCTVIGFPLGAATKDVKAFECSDAIKNGADEIDMVINIGALKSKDYDIVLDDIVAVVKAANGKLVKVIFETCLLTKEEIIIACELSKKAGANFVKTSTGFSKGGATIDDVKLMRGNVQDSLGVKASGGVRSLDDVIAMVDAGASRIGTSNGVAIMESEVSDSNY